VYPESIKKITPLTQAMVRKISSNPEVGKIETYGYVYPGMKGLMDADFKVTAWETDASGAPHHFDMQNALNIDPVGMLTASKETGSGAINLSAQSEDIEQIIVTALSKMAFGKDGHIFFQLGNRNYESTTIPEAEEKYGIQIDKVETANPSIDGPTYFSVGHGPGGILWWGDQNSIDSRPRTDEDPAHRDWEYRMPWYGRFDVESGEVSVARGVMTERWREIPEGLEDRLREKFGDDIVIKAFNPEADNPDDHSEQESYPNPSKDPMEGHDHDPQWYLPKHCVKCHYMTISEEGPIKSWDQALRVGHAIMKMAKTPEERDLGIMVLGRTMTLFTDPKVNRDVWHAWEIMALRQGDEKRKAWEERQTENPPEKAEFTNWTCVQGPESFVWFLIDAAHAEEVDYKTFAEAVDVTGFGLEDWQVEMLPTDWAVTWLKTQLPSGGEAWVMQYGGIEYLCIAGSFDLNKEIALAEEWWTKQAENPPKMYDMEVPLVERVSEKAKKVRWNYPLHVLWIPNSVAEWGRFDVSLRLPYWFIDKNDLAAHARFYP
jgi:hypothetical protein